MPKKAGMYKSERRRKEISRQKKQEERRQRRFNKGDRPAADAGEAGQEEKTPENP